MLGGVKKARTRELTILNESHDHVYRHLIGSVQRVWVVDRAPDGVKLVGHLKNYVQVLLPDVEGLLGSVATARIVGASRWSVDGELVSIGASGVVPPAATAKSNGLRKLVCADDQESNMGVATPSQHRESYEAGTGSCVDSQSAFTDREPWSSAAR